MEIKLSKIEQIVFALLRMSLHGYIETGIDWRAITHDEWNQCYKLSAKHGVMALTWDGVQLVSNECDLPRSLKLMWAMAVLKYEEKYERYCQTAAELSVFLEKHGIGMLQIKGVGLSPYYPTPSHREGGDIDIYTYSLNREEMSDEQANTLTNQLMMQQGIQVDTAHQKHSNFNYKGVPIENHRTFVNVYTTSIGATVNRMLKNVMHPKQTLLCDGKYIVNTPSPAFNAVFLSFHAAQHFGVELNIHLLYDWACLIKKEGWCIPSELKDERFIDFIYAMTYLSNHLLGTKVQIKGSDRLVTDVYEQMMHAPYSEKIPVKGGWAVFCYKAKRLIHSYTMLKKVFDMTVYKMVSNSIDFHFKKITASRKCNR